ncbi:hypothetical protein D9619_011757 [Psilocybe cf. subviscida]|uniref:Uncharacterized protein n=1 Tax=Psilocybe cf. subviscida TaxID=2480587 RepID=A0A8H5B0Z8_9AGAR|nr:hypothetical protein D9619_011757 [Psilocybe cf. subviscida]
MHIKNKRKQATKSAKPYNKEARPRSTTTGAGSTTVITSSKKVIAKVQTTKKKKDAGATGKENRHVQPSGTRPLTRTKPKTRAETEPSSDTLVAPSSPSKPKVEEDAHICHPDPKNGAYTRPSDILPLSSPLPPSSPPLLPPSFPVAAASISDVPSHTVFAAIRKSRRLLGMRASPAPSDAPAELKTRFRSRSASVSSIGEGVVFGLGKSEDDDEKSDDARAESMLSGAAVLGEGARDGERLKLPRTKQSELGLRLPDDMIREDGYAEREEWFDRKKAEYMRPWDAPMDADTYEIAYHPSLPPAPWYEPGSWTPIPISTWSWTPAVSFLSSVAYSRSPCTTLSALFWGRESSEEMIFPIACAECVDRGEADARDCEGGSIAQGRPGHDRTNMGINVDINLDGEAEKEVEDAPWCINGARVRYDGSIVGPCQVCKVFASTGCVARGDDENDGSNFLGVTD